MTRRYLLRVSLSLCIFYFYHWSNALEGNPAMAIQAGAYWLDHAWSGLFVVYNRFTEDRPTGVYFYGSLHLYLSLVSYSSI